MQDPLFSIIIPVYNLVPYLVACLEGILAQSYTQWECLCVDDGSKDGSGALLDQYAARDHRFRVIHQANAGVSSARNVALDHSTGDWILFLDGDDVWHPALLHSLVEGMRTHPEGRLFRFDRLDFKDDTPCPFTPINAVIFKPVSLLHGVNHHLFWDYLFVSYAIHRSLVEGLRFKSYIRGEDRLFITEILLSRVEMLYAIEHPFYGYRAREGSAVHQRASVQCYKDELSHRIDLLLMLEHSSRNFPSQHLWRFCFKKYLSRVKCYTPEEQTTLRAWFTSELERLADGLSSPRKQTFVRRFAHAKSALLRFLLRIMNNG